MCPTLVFPWGRRFSPGTAGYSPAATWNAAYGSTICAERTAVLKAVSEGCREGWTAIAIAGRGEDFCWPCGACRQMLYEFAPNLRVLAARGDGEYKEVTLSELLPCGFGPKSLE